MCNFRLVTEKCILPFFRILTFFLQWKKTQRFFLSGVNVLRSSMTMLSPLISTYLPFLMELLLLFSSFCFGGRMSTTRAAWQGPGGAACLSFPTCPLSLGFLPGLPWKPYHLAFREEPQAFIAALAELCRNWFLSCLCLHGLLRSGLSRGISP